MKNVWIFIFKSLHIIPGILRSIEASDSKTSYNSGILDILSRSCLASPPPPPPPLHPALHGEENVFERWKWVLREIETHHYSILTRVDESCPLYSSPDHIGLKVEKTHLEYVENEVN